LNSIQSKYRWILKYKLHHIPFWALYHYVWWLIYDGNILKVTSNILYLPYSIKYIFYVFFQAAGVYFCLYYLIPKFLEKGKYVSFLLYVFAVIVVISTAILFGYHLGPMMVDVSFTELYKTAPNNPFHMLKSQTFPSSVASMTLAMSIKLTKNWLASKRKQEVLEREKLETEIKFLKSQFNPHFLFNTINSIFVLINKNSELATESLAKFSGLLRYQLYECNEHEIPLNRELEYLKSFIELERLRQNPDCRIDVTIPDRGSENLKIAPFILMPFIENAFKHVSKGDQDNWIRIMIEIRDQHFLFHVSNSVSADAVHARDVVNYGGLGLKNVRRRLDLIYSGNYDLDISSSAKGFEVDLTLTLEGKTLKPRIAIKPEVI